MDTNLFERDRTRTKMPSYTRAYLEYRPKNRTDFTCWATLNMNSSEWTFGQAAIALASLEAAGRILHLPLDPDTMSDVATRDFRRDAEIFRQLPEPQAFSFSPEAATAVVETQKTHSLEVSAMIAALGELGESVRVVMWVCG